MLLPDHPLVTLSHFVILHPYISRVSFIFNAFLVICQLR